MILTVSEQGQVYFHTNIHVFRILGTAFKAVCVR